jgi:hypothetical protein
MSNNILNLILSIDTSTNDEKKKAFWERECLCIVRERTTLNRTEEELSMAKRGLTLENERSHAENEYRQLINLPGIPYHQYLALLNLKMNTLIATKYRNLSCTSFY